MLQTIDPGSQQSRGRRQPERSRSTGSSGCTERSRRPQGSRRCAERPQGPWRAEAAYCVSRSGSILPAAA